MFPTVRTSTRLLKQITSMKKSDKKFLKSYFHKAKTKPHNFNQKWLAKNNSAVVTEHTTFPLDPSLFSRTYIGGSQLLLTPAPGDPTPLSSTDSCTYSHILIHRHTERTTFKIMKPNI